MLIYFAHGYVDLFLSCQFLDKDKV